MEIREDLLHYAWQFQAFDRGELRTSGGEILSVLQPGSHNRGSGPDFSDASLVVAGLRWAGAVECHVYSSDWRRHGHSDDPAYSRVILHVVWQHDEEVCLTDGTVLPVVELRGLIAPTLLARYERLMERLQPGPACLPRLEQVSGLITTAMQERALMERLQAKADRLEHLYESCGRDWEETTYQGLAWAWGMPYNGEAFAAIAKTIPARSLRRLADQPLAVEALLLGQSGLLTDPIPETRDAIHQAFESRPGYPSENSNTDIYQQVLVSEYSFQAARLHLPAPMLPGTLATGRIRPAHQPALRLAQLAALLSQAPPLFDAVRSANTVEALVTLFRVSAGGYWQRRYSFGPEGKTGAAQVGHTMALGLIANAVVPILAAYGRQRNQASYVHKALKLLEELPPEHNHLTKPFEEAGLGNRNAAQSQGLLGLHKQYCLPERCLQCQIGGALLKG